MSIIDDTIFDGGGSSVPQANLNQSYSEANSGENPAVNLAIGRLSYAFDDLSTGYGNFAVEVSHVYNSISNPLFANKIVGVGNGWKLNLHQCLVQSGNDVMFLDAAGETHTFKRFDGNRYYDCQNAKTVLYFSAESKYVTDGVGNKLYFNSNGLLEKSVSCFNDAIEKIYTYDQSNRLVQIHDSRSVVGSNVKNKVTLCYNSNGKLSQVTSYVNFSVKQFEVTYSYDGNDLTGVFVADSDGTAKQVLSFAYANSKLVSVCNSQTCQAYRFTYNLDEKITLVEGGVMAQGAFVSKSSNGYLYHWNTNGASYNTDVTNQNGIVLAYFLNTKGQVTSQFEKVGGNLKTLQKQGSKRTNAFGGTTSPSINNHLSKTTAGSWSLSMTDFTAARNLSEEKLQTFEYAFWLKHSCDYERMNATATFSLNNTSYTKTVPVDGRAKNAWQRVSLPIVFPLDDDDKPVLSLSGISISLTASSSIGTVYVNEIGFAPAPVSKFEFYTNGSYRTVDDVQQVVVQNPSATQATYFTENDLLATQTNYYAHPRTENGTNMFDVVCENGTRRISATCCTLNVTNSAPVNVPATLRTKILSGVPGSTLLGNYSFTDSIMTVTTVGTATAGNNTVTSQTVERTYFNGNKHSYTDEYGVTTNYYYDNFGNLTLVQVKDCNDVVVSSKAYYYDDQNRTTAMDSGDNGINVGYNNKDLLAWQAETAKTNGSLQATGHSVENSYQNHTNLTSAVTEKVSGSTVAQNTVTYQNGEIRTVSDGAVKYGIEKDFVNDKVTYSVFEGVNSATANKVQEDHVSDYYENDDEILVKTHERKFFNKDGDETSSTATDVDVYGRVQTTYKSGVAGGKTQYVYNDSSESTFASTLHRKYEPDGNYTEYSYDDDGNLIGWAEKQSAANGGATRFDVTQVSADTTRYTIDSNSWYVRKVFDETKTMSPRVTSIAYNNIATSTINEQTLLSRNYEYDAEGNAVKKYDDRFTCEHEYTHIGGNPFVTKTTTNAQYVDRASAISTECTYNADGSVKSTHETWQCSYGYGETKYSGSNNKRFTYTPAHRLASEVNDALGINRTFSYDSSGRLSSIGGTTNKTCTYDSRGRLASFGNNAYNYDHFGNRISKTSNTGNRYYTYNHGNNLTKVGRTSATNFAEYKYNSDGVRCKKTVDGVTTEFYLDGDKIHGETRTDNRSGYTRHLRYLYDLDGLAKIRYNDLVCQYVRDQFDNVVALLNASGYILARYEYDAFGNCTVYNATNQVVTDAEFIGNVNPFRWKSFYFDAETGLYYANGSYYDPETGLYLNAAPMESIANKAFVPKGIDRNAPLCNNILELAGNPFTVETTVELTADGTYDVLDDLSGLDRLQYKVQLSIEKFFNWLNKQNVWVRLGVGAFFFSLAVGITVLTGGSVGALFVGLALGIGFAIIGYLFSCLCGNEFSWDDFTNVVVNTFLITSFFMFVSAGISAIAHSARTSTNPVEDLADCSGNCFAAGTLVRCADGTKRIEDVKVGDCVLAYNEETGEQKYKPVVRLFRNESKEWVKVNVEHQEIESTLGHKYYLPLAKKWVSAKDLQNGDSILLYDGSVAQVQSIQFVSYDVSQTTYNFEVADFHTYYVGCGVLVHNEGCSNDWGKERRNYWKKQAKKYADNVEGQLSESGTYNVTKDNLRRMLKGNAPLGTDGKSVNLHHPLGRKGANFYYYVEVTRTYHYANFKQLHPWLYGG